MRWVVMGDYWWWDFMDLLEINMGVLLGYLSGGKLEKYIYVKVFNGRNERFVLEISFIFIR